jgi:hypothetical protein
VNRDPYPEVGGTRQLMDHASHVTYYTLHSQAYGTYAE